MTPKWMKGVTTVSGLETPTVVGTTFSPTPLLWLGRVTVAVAMAAPAHCHPDTPAPVVLTNLRQESTWAPVLRPVRVPQHTSWPGPAVCRSGISVRVQCLRQSAIQQLLHGTLRLTRRGPRDVPILSTVSLATPPFLFLTRRKVKDVPISAISLATPFLFLTRKKVKDVPRSAISLATPFLLFNRGRLDHLAKWTWMTQTLASTLNTTRFTLEPFFSFSPPLCSGSINANRIKSKLVDQKTHRFR